MEAQDSSDVIVQSISLRDLFGEQLQKALVDVVSQTVTEAVKKACKAACKDYFAKKFPSTETEEKDKGQQMQGIQGRSDRHEAKQDRETYSILPKHEEDELQEEFSLEPKGETLSNVKLNKGKKDSLGLANTKMEKLPRRSKLKERKMKAKGLNALKRNVTKAKQEVWKLIDSDSEPQEYKNLRHREENGRNEDRKEIVPIVTLSVMSTMFVTSYL